jgi:tetratricopeptide (TPR) repeat protein
LIIDNCLHTGKNKKKQEEKVFPKFSMGKSEKKDIEKQVIKAVSGWRLWLFRIFAIVVVPVVLFLLLEITLRIVGYGYPSAAIVKCKVNSRLCYCDNIKFNWRFFPRNIARESDPYVFAVDKKDNTYRVFVLGESAARGEPDSAFSFSRILQVMLRQTYPGVNFEVINTAAAAINSHTILEMAKKCVNCDADLFIAYIGNNEVVGPYGPGTVFSSFSESLSLIRFGIAIKTTRFGQFLTSLSEAITAKKDRRASWRGLEMFLGKQVRAGDPRLQTAYKHFQRNLQDISRIACKKGAKIIFCTIGGNLKDCPPFASLHRSSLTEAETKKWDQIYQQGARFESDGDYAKAAECYLAAADIDNFYADLQFRIGRCCWAMGEYDKARDRFIKARELDTLRFRADNHINQIVRAVAGNRAADGVYLVDAAKVFEQNSPYKTTGEELFYEHVHLNFTGNYLLAKTIFEQIKQILPEWVNRQRVDENQLLSEEECARYLAYTDWDRYGIIDKVLNAFVKKAPFTNQLYHQQRVLSMEQKLKALKANLTQDALQKASIQYRSAIQNAGDDWHLHYKYGELLAEDLKDYRAAAEQYRLVQNYFPHSYTGYNALGSVLRALGDYDGAVAQYLKVIRINPTRADAHYYLGWLYQKQGKTDEAIKYYSKTFRLHPDYMPAYNNLAEILYRQGKVDKAVEICRKGLLFVPNSPTLHCNLGTLLNAQGHREQAIKELQTALQLDPNSAQIRRVLKTLGG